MVQAVNDILIGLIHGRSCTTCGRHTRQWSVLRRPIVDIIICAVFVIVIGRIKDDLTKQGRIVKEFTAVEVNVIIIHSLFLVVGSWHDVLW